MYTYRFKAVNLSIKADFSIEIEAITLSEACEKGKKAFFEKFHVEPEESRTERK